MFGKSRKDDHDLHPNQIKPQQSGTCFSGWSPAWSHTVLSHCITFLKQHCHKSVVLFSLPHPCISNKQFIVSGHDCKMQRHSMVVKVVSSELRSEPTARVEKWYYHWLQNLTLAYLCMNMIFFKPLYHTGTTKSCLEKRIWYIFHELCCSTQQMHFSLQCGPIKEKYTSFTYPSFQTVIHYFIHTL